MADVAQVQRMAEEGARNPLNFGEHRGGIAHVAKHRDAVADNRLEIVGGGWTDKRG